MSTALQSPSLSEPIELFRYLRTLVDTAESDRIAYPKFALVEAYWHIGRIVVEIEQAGQERADYGIHLIEALSHQLTQAFGRGYGMSNMWRFKQFYLAFPILAQNGRVLADLRHHLRQELKWSHYRLLMTLDNLQERGFYLQMAADELWTATQLKQLIRNRYYYRVALGEDQLLPGRAGSQPAGPPASPTPLAAAWPVTGSNRTRLAFVKKTLLDRYVGYAFVTQRQYMGLNGMDYWIELVFFHIVLQRYVLVFFGEHAPTQVATYQQLLNQYIAKQPESINSLPIGLLISSTGQVKPLTTRHESTLSGETLAVLPHLIQ